MWGRRGGEGMSEFGETTAVAASRGGGWSIGDGGGVGIDY